jgi:hypothetical protein
VGSTQKKCQPLLLSLSTPKLPPLLMLLHSYATTPSGIDLVLNSRVVSVRDGYVKVSESEPRRIGLAHSTTKLGCAQATAHSTVQHRTAEQHARLPRAID